MKSRQRARRGVSVSDLPPALQAQLTRAEEPAAKRGNKYHVSEKEDRTLDGEVFDSKAEMKGYTLLCSLLPKGFSVERQKEYILMEGFTFAGRKIRQIAYVSDADVSNGDMVFTVDFKGMETTEFRIKKKLFLKRYERPIINLRRPSDIADFVNFIREEETSHATAYQSCPHLKEWL